METCKPYEFKDEFYKEKIKKISNEMFKIRKLKESMEKEYHNLAFNIDKLIGYMDMKEKENERIKSKNMEL